MAPVASSTRSQVRTSAGTSSASARSARRCSSASVRAPTIDRAHTYAAPTSVSASQGMATPLTIHPLRRPPSLSAVTLRRLLGLGFPVVRRVEPSALVARSERLKHALDLLPGRRAADQAVLGHPLLDLERRAVLAAIDVHGHGQPNILLDVGRPRTAWALSPLRGRGSTRLACTPSPTALAKLSCPHSRAGAVLLAAR